jgi:predicted transcriptional regulator
MADRSGIPSRLEQAAEFVSAYLPNKSLRRNELPALQRAVHDAPKRTELGEAAARTPTVNPPERITKPVMPDYIVCLEVGEKFQSLKRHLCAVRHDTMPDQHREMRGMPRDGVW